MTSKSNVRQEEMVKLLAEWKKLYTEALVKALQPTGNVLEIGFETGLAAESIHNYHPKLHTILESNPQRLEAAKKWAQGKKETTIVEGGQEALAKLGKFDRILFNEESVDHDIMTLNFLFPEEGQRLSNEAKRLLGLLEEEMAHVAQKFSDEEIEEFYKKTGQSNLDSLYKFFQTLQRNGNMSKEQFAKFVKKYKLHQTQEAAPSSSTPAKTPDPMLLCLEECLKNHMNPGSRFSSFLANPVSKYEDSLFFDRVITNPEIDYQENTFPIKMSDKTRDALIFLVEKSS